MTPEYARYFVCMPSQVMYQLYCTVGGRVRLLKMLRMRIIMNSPVTSTAFGKAYLSPQVPCPFHPLIRSSSHHHLVVVVLRELKHPQTDELLL